MVEELARIVDAAAAHLPQGIGRVETGRMRCLVYGFARSPEALDGKTPAENCGIEVRGDNKWMTLIQNTKRTMKSA